MSSILENAVADLEAFLVEYRKTYLQSVCAKLGIKTDIRYAALREASAMIALAMELLPEDGKPE